MSLKRLFLPSLPLLLACGHHGAMEPAEHKASIAVAKASRVQELERISVSGTLTPQGGPGRSPPGNASHAPSVGEVRWLSGKPSGKC